jgi:hypothetical protein
VTLRGTPDVRATFALCDAPVRENWNMERERRDMAGPRPSPLAHGPAVDVAQACRALPTDDARVTRQIVLDELANGGATSAGELRIDPADLNQYLGRMP